MANGVKKPGGVEGVSLTDEQIQSLDARRIADLLGLDQLSSASDRLTPERGQALVALLLDERKLIPLLLSARNFVRFLSALRSAGLMPEGDDGSSEDLARYECVADYLNAKSKQRQDLLSQQEQAAAK